MRLRSHAHTHANSQSNLLLDRFQNLSRVLRGGSAVQPVVAYFQVSGGFSRFNLSVCAFTSVRRNSTPPEGGNVIRAAAVIALNSPSLTMTPQDRNGGRWRRLVALTPLCWRAGEAGTGWRPGGRCASCRTPSGSSSSPIGGGARQAESRGPAGPGHAARL